MTVTSILLIVALVGYVAYQVYALVRDIKNKKKGGINDEHDDDGNHQ